MKLSTETQGQTVVISIEGDIDAATAPTVTDYMRETLKDGWVVAIFDLSGVEFMSSAGLRVILDAHQKGRATGSQIVLAAPRAGVYKVLKTAGFTVILACYPTVDEAKVASSAG